MTHYYCSNCDLVLKDHEIDTQRERVQSEFWGAVAATNDIYRTCGACGCDVEECVVCVRCESSRPQPGSDECSACQLVTEEEERQLALVLTPMCELLRRQAY